MFDARIQVLCLRCNEKFLVLASEQGHVVECPNCSGFVDVPNLGNPDPATVEDEERQLIEYNRQLEEYARQSEESVRQMKEAARQQEESARQQVRFGELLSRFEQVIDKLANVVERMNESSR
ncbi:MAG: hypothetical protein U0941_27480 [Planctomycetaceae bacterium]